MTPTEELRREALDQARLVMEGRLGYYTTQELLACAAQIARFLRQGGS